MFYRIDDEIETINADEIDSRYITAGYLTISEIESNCDKLGISRLCCEGGYTTSIEIYEDYTLLHINLKQELFVIVKANMLLIIEPPNSNGQVLNCFMTAISKYPSSRITTERLIYSFFTTLVDNDVQLIDKLGNKITAIEEMILNANDDKNLNPLLLRIKRTLLDQRRYYQQLIGISTTLEANENEVLLNAELNSIANLTARLIRLREEIDSLQAQLMHLQDAYHAQLDLRLNQTMKAFTAITTIFFPLTVIVGWYGMNFSIPELSWRHGYLYVTLLSLGIIAIICVIIKKYKWL